MIDIILYAVGWIILRVTYPNKEERQTVLKHKYDNSLLAVAAEWPLKIFAVIFIIVLMFFLLSVIYRAIFPITP
nr:hypothetical protein [uncultured Psychroserpens sp.]